MARFRVDEGVMAAKQNTIVVLAWCMERDLPSPLVGEGGVDAVHAG
jgi:hypothetical protein